MHRLTHDRRHADTQTPGGERIWSCSITLAGIAFSHNLLWVFYRPHFFHVEWQYFYTEWLGCYRSWAETSGPPLERTARWTSLGIVRSSLFGLVLSCCKGDSESRWAESCCSAAVRARSMTEDNDNKMFPEKGNIFNSWKRLLPGSRASSQT